MWKSREAFEKSTFFKRLKIQGLEGLEGLWSALESQKLRSQRIFRLNPLRGAALSDFEAEGFKIGAELADFPAVYNIDLNENTLNAQHPFWGAGLAYIQDPVALEIVKALDVQKNHWVLDLCAAPGGKSTRIAEQLGNTGWILSNDADLKRARILSGNLLRHGAIRSSVFSKEGAALSALFPNVFDRILMDVPCSGESLFFKRDEKRRDVYESEVQELARLQLNLLSATAQCLKAGGRLVYSTCTYNTTENEDVIRRFLKQQTDFELLSEERRWPHRHNTAGGYWAVLQKKGSLDLSLQKMLRHPEAERHGLLDRDGRVNFYAQSMMSPDLDVGMDEDPLLPPLENFEDWILMTNDEAIAFLSGEALSNPNRKQGVHRMLFRAKWPLGAAKGVESRFNNLIPVELRTQFRNFK